MFIGVYFMISESELIMNRLGSSFLLISLLLFSIKTASADIIDATSNMFGPQNSYFYSSKDNYIESRTSKAARPIKTSKPETSILSAKEKSTTEKSKTTIDAKKAEDTQTANKREGQSPASKSSRQEETPATKTSKLKSIILAPKHWFGKTLRFHTTGQAEVGTASFYGRDWHGHKTANGEIYDMYSMTAAHKTLPFGTHIRVTNLNNGRNCIVRINNRGPFIRGRMLDLSQAAAAELGMISAGVSRVKMEVLNRE